MPKRGECGVPAALKRKKMIKGLAGGLSKVQAAVAVGYSPKSADTIWRRAEANPSFRDEVNAILRAADLDAVDAFRTIKDALKANKEYCGEAGVIEGGPDHMIRVKAAEIVVKATVGYVQRQDTASNFHKIGIVYLPSKDSDSSAPQLGAMPVVLDEGK